MASSKKISVLGSVNLDLIITTDALPRAGETIGGGSYKALPGGKGANVALGVKRLGGYSELLAAIGVDDYAHQALELLKEEMVGLKHLVRKEGEHTGLAFINVSKDGENQIAVASGANAALRPDDLPLVQADAMISQFEVPLETIHAAFSAFEGLKALNASPVTKGAESVIALADLVIVNAGEYESYKNILENFEGIVAITLGADGAVLKRAGQEIANAKPPKIDVVDTTGAGDCFCAALTLALAEGQLPQEALDFACAAGALATTRLGAQISIPTRRQVEAVLSSV